MSVSISSITPHRIVEERNQGEGEPGHQRPCASPARILVRCGTVFLDGGYGKAGTATWAKLPIRHAYPGP